MKIIMNIPFARRCTELLICFDGNQVINFKNFDLYVGDPMKINRHRLTFTANREETDKRMCFDLLYSYSQSFIILLLFLLFFPFEIFYLLKYLFASMMFLRFIFLNKVTHLIIKSAIIFRMSFEYLSRVADCF